MLLINPRRRWPELAYDCFVDSAQLSRIAVPAYRWTKTCFVATSASAAKALSTLRCPTDPEVKPFARDLGVTSSGVRRRLLGLAQHRMHKARARHTKLCKLRVPGQRHRLRIVRASICMAGLFGHQALGVSPKRRKWYRTITANHLGRQKLGSLDLVFTVLGHLCEDPFCDHFKTALQSSVQGLLLSGLSRIRLSSLVCGGLSGNESMGANMCGSGWPAPLLPPKPT